jgi:hypothetical protein
MAQVGAGAGCRYSDAACALKELPTQLYRAVVLLSGQEKVQWRNIVAS